MERENIIPEGMRDIIFDECDNREFIRNKFNSIFDSFGYREVRTPEIEFYKTFFKEEEFLREEEVFKFFDSEGRILVLKPDMTIPIGRLVATKLKGVELPLRLRYASNIFRLNKSLGGKQNEYLDCGVELIGVKGILGDIEVLVLAIESLKSIGINNFKIEIGNINFFNAAFSSTGIDEDSKEKLAELLENKRLADLDIFIEKLNLNDGSKKFFKKLPWLFGGIAIIEEGIRLDFNKEIKRELIYLKKLYNLLKELGYEKYISFDLGMVPRVNYYTGLIFRGYIDGASSSVLSGGRYDNLIGKFGRKIEAVGFSINVDMIWDKLEVNKNNNECEILEYKESEFLNVLKKGLELRRNGKKVRFVKKEEV